MTRPWITLLVTIWAAFPLFAADLPEGGKSIVADNAVEGLTLKTSNDAKASSEIKQVQGAPGDKALVVVVPAKPEQKHHVQLKLQTTQPVSEGDTLHLRLTWRADPSIDSEHEAAIGVAFQRASPPWTGSHYSRQIARADWQTVDLPFKVKETLDAGQAEITIHLGEQAQTVQIGAIQLLNYGNAITPDKLPKTRPTYGGRSADAPWRTEADERIDRLRKADLAVLVVDAQGNPVPDAQVHATLTRHAFRFGTAVSVESFHGIAPRGLPFSDPVATMTPDDVRQLREQTLKYFNEIVPGASLAVGGWSNQQHRSQTMALIEWAEANGLSVRGHFLMQPDMTRRTWLRGGKKYDDDPRAMLPLIHAYLDDVLPALRGRIVNWDAINHAGRWADEPLGREDQAEILRRARALDPSAKLYVNENFILAGGDELDDRQRLYREKIDYFRTAGAPVDGIGFMAHFDQRLTGIPVVLERLDSFAQYGKPLQVTEFDIKHPDDALAGEYTRDFLTAVFSHPAVEGFVMWGIWDGDHWKGSAPLYARDWSLKPSGRAYIDLVSRRWHTDARGPTDAAGGFRTRGFLGAYTITVAHEGKSQTAQARLLPGGSSVTVRLP